jgi:NADH-ubiquinone oxidoreductase chain 5
MAAPTPVSSLVHSSTLVTAGVYLLFRFSELLANRANLSYLLNAGIFTIIMAGARALKELDIKKIVALSTLRQLGLIIATLGLGMYETAYFHLLTHAFFKALLFMAVGNIIHLSSDYQDLRKIRLMDFCYPVSLSFSLVANCSLCGLPFIAGFYSKDLILELILVGSESFLVSLIIFLAVGLTVMYTVRFVFLIICGGLSRSPCLSGNDNDWAIGASMATLWPLAVSGGRLLI